MRAALIALLVFTWVTLPAPGWAQDATEATNGDATDIETDDNASGTLGPIKIPPLNRKQIRAQLRAYCQQDAHKDEANCVEFSYCTSGGHRQEQRCKDFFARLFSGGD